MHQVQSRAMANAQTGGNYLCVRVARPAGLGGHARQRNTVVAVYGAGIIASVARSYLDARNPMACSSTAERPPVKREDAGSSPAVPAKSEGD